MSLSITQTPGVITPAYNPMYYNVYSISYNTLNFAWTEDLTIQGSKLPHPSLSNAEYTTQTLGSFIKSPTERENQYWEPSRVVQTFLSYNFLPTINDITPSGEECVAVLYNTLSYQNHNTNKTVNDQTVSTYVFNGGDDRNDFRNFNTSPVGVQQSAKPYNYIPNYLNASKSRFLTHFNERTVDLNDTGTLSCLNATFSAETLHNTFTTIKADTDAFDFTTYKNGSEVERWSMINIFRNHQAYNPAYGVYTKYNRVDIPAYPKNLKENAPWTFVDNYFTGTFGMISNEPHNLQVGDNIWVYQDPGYTYSGYNGYATVTEVVSPYIISTDLPWLGTSPVNGGSVINVDKNCVLTIVDDTWLAFTAVTNNGGFAEFHFASGVDVSNIKPRAMFFTRNSVNYDTINDSGSDGIYENVLDFTPTSILSNMFYNGPDTGYILIRERMPLSTQSFFNNIDSYKVQFSYYSGATMEFLPYGDGVTFKIEQRCGKHDRIELFWLNKLGAFDSLLFKGKNTKSIDFIKETYTKRLGDMANSPYIYDVIDYRTSDFEKQNFNGYQNTKFTVSTGWISEIEGDRVIECMGSNTIYMYKDDVFIPVIATIDSVDVKTKLNNKLVYYTISLDLTYNRISQRR